MGAPRKMIEGVVLNLGGEDYLIPPLNLQQLKTHAGIIDQLAEKLSPKEQRPLQVTLITAALNRNYPELTEARAEELLDLGNLLPTYMAVMGLSGFQRVRELSPGETPPGE